MAELKTQPNSKSVRAYLDSVQPGNRRKDCFTLQALMEDITQRKARMWGDSVVGFGEYHYTYASGHSGKSMVTGFAPRARNLVVYIMPGFSHYRDIMKRLGKYKTGKSCLYLNTLVDIDFEQLRKLITESVKYMHQMYECK